MVLSADEVVKNVRSPMSASLRFILRKVVAIWRTQAVLVNQYPQIIFFWLHDLLSGIKELPEACT
jgi:hypothetical protein